MARDSQPQSFGDFWVVLGSVVALLVVALVFIFSIAGGEHPSDLEARRAAARLAIREKLDHDALDLIQSYGWVDKAKGVARAPVASLFASTAELLKARKPVPSQIKVEPPLPMPVIDPNSTEPPMPAMPSAPQGADTVRFGDPAAPAAGAVPTPSAAAAPAPSTVPVAAPPVAPAPSAAPAPVAPSASAPAPAAPPVSAPPATASPAPSVPAAGGSSAPPAQSDRPPLVNRPETFNPEK